MRNCKVRSVQQNNNHNTRLTAIFQDNRSKPVSEYHHSGFLWRWWRQLELSNVQSSSRIVITSKSTCNVLQIGCPSCRPTDSVRAVKGKVLYSTDLLPQAHLGSSILALTTKGSWLPWGGLLRLVSTDKRPGSPPKANQERQEIKSYVASMLKQKNLIFRHI